MNTVSEWIWMHQRLAALFVLTVVGAVGVIDLVVLAHAGPLSALAGPAWTDPAPPPPGCGFTSAVPWSPCAETPPWGQQFPGGWTWDNQPGTWGPGGYNPIQDGR